MVVCTFTLSHSRKDCKRRIAYKGLVVLSLNKYFLQYKQDYTINMHNQVRTELSD